MQKASYIPRQVKHDAGGRKILCWIAHISRPSSIESGSSANLLAPARRSELFRPFKLRPLNDDGKRDELFFSLFQVL